MPLIETDHLTRLYKLGGETVTALDGVSVSVDEGDFVAVMGPSGSGKSTFMNVAAGLDDASSGEVHVAGHPLHALDDRARTILRREHVGFVFQFYNLIPSLTVRENVRIERFELAEPSLDDIFVNVVQSGEAGNA